MFSFEKERYNIQFQGKEIIWLWTAGQNGNLRGEETTHIIHSQKEKIKLLNLQKTI